MVSIAIAQTVPIRGDVEANMEAHLHLAGLAAGERARLLVFPELSLTGYELDLGAALAFSENDPRLSPLAEAASSYGMTIVAGAPVRIGATLHIGAFIVRPDGAVDLYTKHHLGAFSAAAARDGVVPPPEATVFAAGTSNPLITVDEPAAAVAICADLGHPSHAAAAAARGARVYVVGAFIIPSEYERAAARLRRSAVQHAMIVSLANFGGPSGGLAAAGRSRVWSEAGNVVLQMPPTGAGVGVAVRSRSGWTATVRMVGAN